MAGALFFDIAPKWTGYCVGDGSKAPVADAWRFPDLGEDYGALACEMEDWVRALAREHDPDFAGYEAPIPPKRHDALHDLRRILGLGVVLEAVCQRIGEERGRPLPCGELDVRKIKSFATGDRWAEKKLVTAAAVEAGIPILPRTQADGRFDAGDAAVGWVITLHEIDPIAASPWFARFKGTLL